MERVAKQFIYGTVYLIIFFGLTYAGYLSFLKAAPSCVDKKQNQDETGVDCGGSKCGPCIGNPEPIAVRLSTIFFVKDPVALVRLTNPNNQLGAESLAYLVEVLDSSGSTIRTFQGETYVYPGDQEKNLVFPLA